MDKILAVLQAAGIPFAYDHFAEGEAVDHRSSATCFRESDNFAADGKVYYKISRVNVELYTDKKDLNAEQKVEDALDAASIFYAKSEVWIDSEKLYEVLYEMEV